MARLDFELLSVPQNNENPTYQRIFFYGTFSWLSLHLAIFYTYVKHVLGLFSFWRAPSTFDPAQVFTLWADSYKEHYFYCHRHMEEVWPLEL